MPKVIGSFKVKDWDQWVNAFTDHNKAREKAGIKIIYVGNELGDKNKVHVVMDVPAPDTLQNFMQQPENQKVIQESGHIQETTKMVMCSD
tara:strand:+ start:154 stop:423 length:270 start_codon:yes stop_codon:yes gene_type:complete